MTKQEFLAMSLPYELHGITANRVVLINGIEYEKEFPVKWKGEKFIGVCGFGIMPILHQLSDLTKEIEHKGKKFVPIVRLGWNISIKGWSDANTNIAIENIRFIDAIRLIEWHFDIAELIDKGEAIDVNTLTENPYK